MPRLVNMTHFVQRPGLRRAQEQALQNPLAWSPLPWLLFPRDQIAGFHHKPPPLVARTDSSQDRAPRRAIAWSATSSLLALPIPRCDGVTLRCPHDVQPSDVDTSPKRRGSSLRCCCLVYCTPRKDQGRCGSVC